MPACGANNIGARRAVPAVWIQLLKFARSGSRAEIQAVRVPLGVGRTAASKGRWRRSQGSEGQSFITPFEVHECIQILGVSGAGGQSSYANCGIDHRLRAACAPPDFRHSHGEFSDAYQWNSSFGLWAPCAGFWSRTQRLAVSHQAGVIDNRAGDFLRILDFGCDRNAIDNFDLGDHEIFSDVCRRSTGKGNGERHFSGPVPIH
jgi:hypothetical protein